MVGSFALAKGISKNMPQAMPHDFNVYFMMVISQKNFNDFS